MFRTILWALCALLYTLGKTPKLFKGKKMNGAEKDAFFENVTANWAQHVLKKIGVSVTVNGCEHIPQDKGVLFVSNHQGNFDILIFLAFIRKEKGFIAKSELLKVPILRTWMREIQCVFLDRKDMKSSAKSITEGIQVLKSGHSMVIFPEGTRSKSRHMGEFKAGSFKLATKSKVPVVPVTLNGTYHILEEKNRIQGADIQVIIHPPIETKGLSKEEERKLPQEVQQIVLSGLTENK